MMRTYNHDEALRKLILREHLQQTKKALEAALTLRPTAVTAPADPINCVVLAYSDPSQVTVLADLDPSELRTILQCALEAIDSRARKH